jgi:hypothetical protein
MKLTPKQSIILSLFSEEKQEITLNDAVQALNSAGLGSLANTQRSAIKTLIELKTMRLIVWVAKGVYRKSHLAFHDPAQVQGSLFSPDSEPSESFPEGLSAD